ncbi:hypothetical protein [Salibacterium salarium]|uniref:hypothetical protein n=1 Tax=Salibacterium salarium TaxID=284579 RepID=UPI001639A3E7|nr:hypothetical protein [Salibacterium salarium]
MKHMLHQNCFSILVIWGIGLFIMLWRPKKFQVGVLFMWLAIPVGFYGTAALI